MDNLAKALMVAIRVHAGQVDKQGESYLLHVLRVVEAVSDEAKPLAALHDVCEESHRPATEVALECRLDPLEMAGLLAITRWPESETYAEYIDGLSGFALAREVKLADLRDNLGRIPPPPYGREKWGDSEGSMEAYEPDWASLRRRYEKAIATLEAA